MATSTLRLEYRANLVHQLDPQRGRNRSESTGLGLDIVRRAAQDHGAEIEFSNDQGAVIRIVFSGPK